MEVTSPVMSTSEVTLSAAPPASMVIGVPMAMVAVPRTLPSVAKVSSNMSGSSRCWSTTTRTSTSSAMGFSGRPAIPTPMAARTRGL